MSEANTFTLRKVKWASLAGVEGVLTNYYESSFKVKRVTAVKVALFTLRYSAKLVSANAVSALLLREYSAKY